MVNSVTKSWSRTASLLPSAMYWARGPRGTSGPLVFSFGPFLKNFKFIFIFGCAGSSLLSFGFL